MVALTMQTTPVYPTPFFNAIAILILHMSLIINAGLNLYVCGDLRKHDSQPVSRDTRKCLVVQFYILVEIKEQITKINELITINSSASFKSA